MVITWHPRLDNSFCSSGTVMLEVLRICGNCVMRIPMKPVSFMTSRMSVNATRGNEFHRLAPSAHRTFLLAGRRPAARASVVPKRASAVRRVIVTDVTRFAPRLPGVVGVVGRRAAVRVWCSSEETAPGPGSILLLRRPQHGAHAGADGAADIEGRGGARIWRLQTG